VRLARRALQDRLTAGTADVVKGNATSMPWPDGRFSLVTCLWGIEVFAHPQGVLREIRRVLRPGGRAVLSAGVVIRSEGARARLAKSFPTAHFDWTEDDVRSMIVAAGFEEPDFTDADLGSPVLNRVNQLMTGFDTFRIAGARVPVG
jgi:SAM-dependent methyltransferase